METNKSAERTDDRSAEIDFSLLGVLRTLWQWRKSIIYTTLAAIVGAVVISLTLSDYYMSSTSFLAINPDQANPDVIAGAVSSKTALYGNMNDLDRLMAIAESDELADYLIEKHGLYAHYDIDTSDAKASTKVRMKFRDLYEVTKTEKDAILVEVEDKDAVLAAKLANDARDRIDFISRKLIRDAMERSVTLLRLDVEKKKAEFDLASDSIMKLQEKYDIYDLNGQMKDVTAKSNQLKQELTNVSARLAAYKSGRIKIKGRQDSIAKLTVLQAGMTNVKAEVDSQLLKISRGVQPMMAMYEVRGSFSRTLNNASHRLELFESALKSQPSLIAVLEVAKPSVIKSRPKRMFIVIGAAMLAFILSILGVLAIDNARQFDWKKITD